MTKLIPFGERLKIGVMAIALFLLGIGFALGALLLASWSAILLVSVLVVISILSLVLAWLLKKIFGLKSIGKAWVFLTLLITVVVTLPYFYLGVKSETDPLVLPQAVLSDGKKTVVFQGMVHVGSENFYKTVVYDLEEAIDEGYKLYYEGIMPSTDEANKWFSDTVAGGASLSDNYRQLAEICGVKFQLDYFKLLIHDIQSHPERHATVDVTTADLKVEYERLQKQDPAFSEAVIKDKKDDDSNSTLEGTTKKVFAFLQNADEGQKNIIGTVCRGFFSYVLKVDQNKKRATLDPLLLDFRNRHLAQQIQIETSDKIYITYGAGHLPGIIALLKAANPAWEVKSLKWLRGMAAPEHFEGQL